MKKSIIFSVVAMAVGVQAGVYTQDFEGFSGATDLGDGTTIAGSHAVVYENPGFFTALRLTQDQVAGQTANFALSDLDAGSAITGFTATFDSLVKSVGGNPADGFSFNFGTLPGTLPNGSEEGMTSGSLLSIGWDTYTGDGGRGMYVRVNGSVVASSAAYYAAVHNDINQAFTGATIVLDENGLDVTYNGVACWTDLDVSGFTASAGDRFAFAARTGGAHEDLFIDNLNVSTIPEPATMGLVALFGGSVFVVRRVFQI